MKKRYKNGFAISSMLYGVVFLGITIILLLMSTLSFSKKTENKTVGDIETQLGNMESIKFETGDVVKTPNVNNLTSLTSIVIDVRVYYSGGSLDTSNLAGKLKSVVDGSIDGNITKIDQSDEVAEKVKLLKITIVGFSKNGALQLQFDEGALVIQKTRKVRNSKTMLNIDLTKKNISCYATGFDNYYDGASHSAVVTVSDPTENYTIFYGTTAGIYDLDHAPSYSTSGNRTVYFKITAPGYNSVTGSVEINIKPFENFDVSPSDFKTVYDGKAHSITVYVSNTTGATIKYGTSAGNYTTTTNPAYTAVGTYKVYYQVSKDYYNTSTGSATVTITEPVWCYTESGTKTFAKYEDGTPIPWNGAFSLISQVNNNFAVDITNNTLANGTNIELYTVNSTAAQTFTFRVQGTVSDNPVYYTIKSNSNQNFALDVAGANPASPTNIQLYQNNTSSAQKWKIYRSSTNSSYYYFQSQLGTCLDDYGAAASNNANIVAHTCNKTNAQMWKIRKR